MEGQATQTGAEAPIQNQQESGSTGSDDAALLSAYLAEQDASDQGQSQDAPEPAGQAQEQEAKALDDLFVVKIDGEERQVSRDELLSNYQKAQASAKRFEEAAALRKQAETQQQQASAELQRYQQELSSLAEAQNAYRQQLETVMQFSRPTPQQMQYLLDNNPQEYLRQKEIMAQQDQQLQQVQMAQAYREQQEAAIAEQQRSAFLENEHKQLIDLIPQWKDTEVRKKESQEIAQHMFERGYTEEQVKALSNSMAKNIELARDAMLYRKLVQKASATSKKVETLPPRVERTQAPLESSSGASDLKARAMKTGRIDDVAQAIAALGF